MPTDMKYKQARTYKDYEALFARRRGDAKVIFRDCLLTKRGDNFEVHYNRGSKELMFTVAPNNLVTLHSLALSVTKCYRLSAAVGMFVYSDKSRHRNKLNTIRIRPLVGRDSMPYAPGLQVQLNYRGVPIAYHNVPDDVSKLVAKEAKTIVKDGTSAIRHLAKVSARLGMFDEMAKAALNYHTRKDVVSDNLQGINYQDPLGDDAILLFRVGLTKCAYPRHSGHINGVWRSFSEEERINTIKENAIEAGLRALRGLIYSQTEGSYEYKVVSKGTHQQVS